MTYPLRLPQYIGWLHLQGGDGDDHRQKKIWTDEELMRLLHEGKAEVVDGKLVLITPAGLEQEDVEAVLTTHLVNYVHPRRLGRVYTEAFTYKGA